MYKEMLLNEEVKKLMVNPALITNNVMKSIHFISYQLCMHSYVVVKIPEDQPAIDYQCI